MDNATRKPGPIRFKTTFTNTILEACLNRGWVNVSGTLGGADTQLSGATAQQLTEWDFLWVDREVAWETFDNLHLLSWQRVNHFRNDKELCRKDLLVKNLKKRRRVLAREGSEEEALSWKDDFWPTTYVLPGEYALFAEDFKRSKSPNTNWIMKPIGRSQGRGIFIFNKLSQISKWKSDSRWEKTKDDAETYVVQKYIKNPYLIAGRKFDMRLYVLVTSFMPLTVWIYRAGFCRFSHARYSNAVEDLDDMEPISSQKHLTNVSIQKKTESYDKVFGGKWELRQLKLHLMGIYGAEKADKMFWSVQEVILKSLQSVQQVMINDKHCFELYGYDVLFDDELKPWLLEVNASPSLSGNTPEDRQLKQDMLGSVLDIIDLEGQRSGHEVRVGGFDLAFANGQAVTRARPSQYSTMIGSQIPSCKYGDEREKKEKASKAAEERAALA
ncbi:unnamed protein product [Chrysoparadoxa australica]